MNPQTEQKTLDISWETIFKISIAVIAFYIIYAIRDILIWFIFSLIISILFNPAISFLQKRKVPRALGVVLVYTFFLGIFGLLIYLLSPLFSYEIQQFLKILPHYFEKISPPLRGLGFEAFENVETFLQVLEKNIEGMSESIFNVFFTFFGGIFSAIFVIATAVFLSAEEKVMERVLILLFPKKYEASALNIWSRCQKKVSAWFGGRILACLFVGVASYITFLVFKVKYPFTLGLVAGVFNFVPFIGPLITGILLFLLIFPLSLLKGIFVLIAFVLIQQIENNIISPILMKKFLGLPGALVLISLVAGGKLWGLLGAILAVPLAGILFEFLKEFLQKRKEREAVEV